MNKMQYVLTSTACLSIFYIVYILIFSKGTNFTQLRAYLLLSIFLSILLPLSGFRINPAIILTVRNNTYHSVDEPQVINNQNTGISYQDFNVSAGDNNRVEKRTAGENLMIILRLVYICGAILLIIRIVIRVIFLVLEYFKSTRIREDGFVFIQNDHIKNTFSFFIWIFLQPNDNTPEDMKQIIAHEKIHAAQFHSFDLILIELLTTFMWFNPLVWMMRKSIQLIHEYQADEGTLGSGVDKTSYQALLINTICEEKLICLSSNFNQSLIKKRMIMMNRTRSHQKYRLKILTLLPLTMVLLLCIACINGKKKVQVVTAIEPVRMNVLYIGLDNPVKIAASGYKASELNITVDNGKIAGKNGEYIVRPERTGMANVIVLNKRGKEIQKSTFRVKTVPDPVALFAGKNVGPIDKKTALEQDGMTVYMRDFDYDLSFEIVEFTMAIIEDGFVKEAKSTSQKLTSEQKQFLGKLRPGFPLIFSEIKCKGPDGFIRKLPNFVLKVE